MKKLIAMLLALLMLASLMTGCASKETTPAQDTETKTDAAPADTNSAEETTDAEPTENPYAEQIAECIASFEQEQSAWTEWTGPTTGPKIAEGKKICIINQDSSNGGEALWGDQVAEACETAGWDYVIMDGQGDYSVIRSCFSQAIATGCDGIVTSADAQDLQTLIEEALSYGIPTVGIHASDVEGPVESLNLLYNNTSDPVKIGNAIADYAIADSNGTGRVVIVYMIADYDAMFTILAFPFQQTLIEKAKKMQVVANYGVGYDNIDVECCTAHHIFVVNTPTTVTEPTAELAVAIMMAITKGVVMYDKELRQTRHMRTSMFFDRDMLLFGKTMGILGFGRIGQAVARRAQGLGMNVIYYDPFPQTAEREAELGVRHVSFDELLAEADVVSCHAPYTPENHHLMDLAAFKKMKKTAYFINAARGPIMSEHDLVTALKTGEIRGAATDVYEFEPNVSEELAEIENVVITPHIGSNVMEARKNMVDEALDGVCAILRGERCQNVVNRTLQ